MIKKEMYWTNEDPRNVYCDLNRNCESIIILRPNPESIQPLIGYGDVYTEYGWSIYTNFEDYKCLDVDCEWDKSWWWTETIEINK